MLTQVREKDGGYKVRVYDASGDVEVRETNDLAAAFAMQKSVQDTGKWPDGREPGK